MEILACSLNLLAAICNKEVYREGRRKVSEDEIEK
jgi:hypothetical protein